MRNALRQKSYSTTEIMLMFVLSLITIGFNLVVFLVFLDNNGLIFVSVLSGLIIWRMAFMILNLNIKDDSGIRIPRNGDSYLFKRSCLDLKNPFERRKENIHIVIDEVLEGYVSYRFAETKTPKLKDGVIYWPIVNYNSPATLSMSIKDLNRNYEYSDDYIKAGEYVTKGL